MAYAIGHNKEAEPIVGSFSSYHFPQNYSKARRGRERGKKSTDSDMGELVGYGTSHS